MSTTRSSSLVGSRRTSIKPVKEDGSRKSHTGDILSSTVGDKEETAGWMAGDTEKTDGCPTGDDEKETAGTSKKASNFSRSKSWSDYFLFFMSSLYYL